jgi:hypothetical protein
MLALMGSMGRHVFTLLRLSYVPCPLVLILAALWVTRDSEYLPVSLQNLRPVVRVLMVAGQSGIAVVAFGSILLLPIASSAPWMILRAAVSLIQAAGTIVCLVYVDRLAAAFDSRMKQCAPILAVMVVGLCLLNEVITFAWFRSLAGTPGVMFKPNWWYIGATMVSRFGSIVLNAGYVVFYISRRRFLGRVTNVPLQVR